MKKLPNYAPVDAAVDQKAKDFLHDCLPPVLTPGMTYNQELVLTEDESRFLTLPRLPSQMNLLPVFKGHQLDG